MFSELAKALISEHAWTWMAYGQLLRLSIHARDQRFALATCASVRDTALPSNVRTNQMRKLKFPHPASHRNTRITCMHARRPKASIRARPLRFHSASLHLMWRGSLKTDLR